MKTIKLQFGGLIENGDEEGTFTCILEEKGNYKRKIFLQLTKNEGKEISFYLKQNENKKKETHNALLDFVKAGYTINSTRIAIKDEQQVGIINIKRGREKLQVALSICVAIVLMKNYDIATSIDTKSFKSFGKQYSPVEYTEKRETKFAENVLDVVDKCIYSENYIKLRNYVDLIKKMINKRK